jgi:hypothetical protein
LDFPRRNCLLFSIMFFYFQFSFLSIHII